MAEVKNDDPNRRPNIDNMIARTLLSEQDTAAGRTIEAGDFKLENWKKKKT